MTTYFSTLDTPVGELTLVGSERALTRILFPRERMVGVPKNGPESEWVRSDRPFEGANDQLKAYFAGELREFDMALAPAGTPFQREVWDALLGVPFGETCSYGALAARLGRPKASRAVGAANGRNPLPIVIPCHRIIGADGSLTGFGGGVAVKQWLLEHEGALPGTAELF